MTRRLIAILTVGAATVTLYYALSSDGPANLVAVCTARVEPELRARAADAGLTLRRYEPIRFPARRDVDAGVVGIGFPPAMLAWAKRGLHIELRECDLDSCAAHPGICALWDAPFPVRLASKAQPCVRRPYDGGTACTLLDGGDPGRSIYNAGELAGAQCEPVVGGCPRGVPVAAGEGPEVL